jgi:hypothetical protein
VESETLEGQRLGLSPRSNSGACRSSFVMPGLVSIFAKAPADWR